MDVITESTCPVCGRPGSCCAEVDRLRSSQAEDHEAGIEAMRVAAEKRGLLRLETGEPSWVPPLDEHDLRALAKAALSRRHER